MPIQLAWGRVDRVKADAIVCLEKYDATKEDLEGSWPYTGVGKELRLNARESLEFPLDELAEAIPGTGLNAKFLIVTRLPRLKDVFRLFRVKAASSRCRECLELARSLGCRKIAMPVISMDKNPDEDVLAGMFREIQSFLKSSEKDYEIILMLGRGPVVRKNPEKATDVSDYILNKLEAPGETVRAEEPEEPGEAVHAEDAEEAGESFGIYLEHQIDRKLLIDADVCRNANLDHKTFHEICLGLNENDNFEKDEDDETGRGRKTKEVLPDKGTALALCIALKLNLDETKELLKKAGYELSHSDKRDIIVEYYILRKEYDICSINLSLLEHSQEMLGSGQAAENSKIHNRDGVRR